jgi:hypothetical protein
VETLDFAGKPTRVQPTRALIRAAIKRQLLGAFQTAHLAKIKRSGRFSFSFIAPWQGTMEVRWYGPKKAHKSAKTKLLLLARSRRSYPAAKKETIKLKLTTEGRRVLRGKKQLRLKAEAIFTIAHQKPITWAGTIVLHR